MPKTELGDVCGRYLSSRLSKQKDSSISNDQQSINNEHIATEHKRHTILTQKLFFKSYNKNPLDKLRQRYTIIQNNNNIENIIMPANNDVLLTAFNNNTTNGTNGTNSNHQYRSTYVSCSNGNGNHSSSS